MTVISAAPVPASAFNTTRAVDHPEIFDAQADDDASPLA
jgi:hypothetical protein